MSYNIEKKTIGEMCDVIAGQSPEGKYYNSNGIGTPFYQGKKDFGEIYLNDPTTWTTHCPKIALPGDILMSVRAPVGPVNLAKSKVCIGRGLAAIRIRGDISREFLHYQLIHLQPNISGTDGAVYPSINKSQIEKLRITWLPPEEQVRIVAILDQSFAMIEEAKINTEKNIQNTRELFESYLQTIMNSADSDWSSATLNDVCVRITDGKHGDCIDDPNSGYYFLSAKDVRNGTLNYSKARQILKGDFEETHRRTNLESGDVLITNSGTIGRMAIAPEDDKTTRTTFQKSVATLKPRHDLVDASFLYYNLKSALARFVSISAGAAQKNLLLRDLRSFKFRYPESMLSQRAVVRQITIIESSTNELNSMYLQKLANLGELQMSILHEAFSGNL